MFEEIYEIYVQSKWAFMASEVNNVGLTISDSVTELQERMFMVVCTRVHLKLL